MLFLILASMPAHACSCSESVWVDVIAPSGDAVPTNTRIYAFLAFDTEVVHLGDGDVMVGVETDDGDNVEVATIQIRRSTDGAVAIADLVEPLEPATDYWISVSGWPDWGTHTQITGPGRFRTADADDLEAPAPPGLVRATVARRSGFDSCGGSREVRLNITAEPGAILTVHSGQNVWMVPPGDYTWTDSFCNPSPVPQDDLFVIAEDSAGNASEASESAPVRSAVCGCAASPVGTAGWWMLALIPLVGRARRSDAAG